MSNNKILSRDNLAKRQNVPDKTCLFYCELESVYHLFFECVVAKAIWRGMSNILGVPIGNDFESAAKWWICNKNKLTLNMLTSCYG